MRYEVTVTSFHYNKEEGIILRRALCDSLPLFVYRRPGGAAVLENSGYWIEDRGFFRIQVQDLDYFRRDIHGDRIAA